MPPIRSILIAALTLVLAACEDKRNPLEGLESNEFGFMDQYKVKHIIDVGKAPHGMDVRGHHLYVANAGDGTIGVVDLRTGVMIDTVPVPGTPLDVKWVGNSMLVTSFQDKVVYQIAADGTVQQTFEMGASPSLFSAGPDFPVTVTTEFGDALNIIDLTTGAVTSKPTGKQPYPAHITKDGVLAFIPNRADGTVTVYDLLNDRTAATVEACKEPEGGTLTPDEESYIVACGGDDKIVFINTASFEVTDEVSEHIGPRPFSVAMDPNGNFGFVNNAGGSTVSVFSVFGTVVTEHIPVGQQPIVMRIFGDTLYVANEVSNTIHVIPFSELIEAEPKNEVIVLGMLHGGHLNSEDYGLDRLARAIRRMEPDFVLTEIPRNRFTAALHDWLSYGEIREPRVKRFPEYTDMLFSLQDEMSFTVEPTAAWNAAMNHYRSAALERLAQDPARADEWAAHEAAMATMNAGFAAGGDDPMFIHSDAYDDLARAGYGGPYDTFFNDDLGPGGWTTINNAHYANIAKVLDDHRNYGLRFVITYGAGHKYWFLDQLKKRNDITLIDPRPFFAED